MATSLSLSREPSAHIFVFSLSLPSPTLLVPWLYPASFVESHIQNLRQLHLALVQPFPRDMMIPETIGLLFPHRRRPEDCLRRGWERRRRKGCQEEGGIDIPGISASSANIHEEARQ